METKEAMNRVEIGRNILVRIEKAIEGEEYQNIFPALSWLLADLGAEVFDSKEEFIKVLVGAVSSAYDAHVKDVGDGTTH